MRMAYESEMLYAKDYPFVDYGIDLDTMSKMEKGVMITQIARSPTDTDKANKDAKRFPKEIKEETERYL